MDRLIYGGMAIEAAKTRCKDVLWFNYDSIKKSETSRRLSYQGLIITKSCKIIRKQKGEINGQEKE